MLNIKTVVFIPLIVFFFNSTAQETTEELFFRDLSFNYGIHPALISDYNQPNLVGTMFSVQGSFFFYNNIGVRTGLTYITNMEGTDGSVNIPLMFAFRTKTNRDFYLGSNIDSFGDLLFQIILGLIPKQAEYNVGINLGYIEPNNNLSLVDYGDGYFFEEGYQVQNRFATSIDAGLRLTYRIYRFGVVLSPSVSYVFTNNFEYYSELGLNSGYTPNWFMNLTFGISYRF